MISVTQQTIAGKTVWLIMADWNTDSPMRLTAAFETEISKSPTGIESRRPKRNSPRFQLQYDFIADEADLTVLRNLMGSIGEDRVAIPFWPDSTEHGLTPALSPQITLGYDSDGTVAAIAEAGATPAGDHTVPLIIGRLKRPDHRYLDGRAAIVSIAIEEDSPYSHRLELPADPGSFTLTPNWRSAPNEKTSDNLQFDSIGDGRELILSGEPTVTWEQEATFTLTRAELIQFLGWFAAHQGSYAAFEMDSFFSPGTDTPQAPLEFDGTGGRGFMRFAEDHIKVSFLNHELVEIKTKFEQVLDTTTEQHPKDSILFEIWSDADPTDIARLTSHEAPITANGQTWTPARIKLDKLKSTLKLENDTAKVELVPEDVPQVSPILRHETLIPVRCRIYSADLGTDPATTSVLTFGKTIKWELEGQTASFEIKPFNGILERSVPRFHLSQNCNYCVFDAACGVNKASYKLEGTLEYQWNGSWVRIVPLTTIPAGFTHNFLAGGWIEVGTGLNKQVRLIKENWDQPTGDGWSTYPATRSVHILLDRPIRTDITPYGTAVVAYAGCDGSYSTCVDKFNNGQRFGGAPYAPRWIWQKPNTVPTAGK